MEGVKKFILFEPEASFINFSLECKGLSQNMRQP